MKNIVNATIALFFFKPYTNMSRPLEIGYGIVAWFGVVTIIFACS